MGNTFLIVVFAIDLLLVIVLILKARCHASIALLLAALAMAVVTRTPLSDIIDIIAEGVASTLGSLTLTIGLGAVLGKIVEESGGAHSIATTLLAKFGSRRSLLVMAALGLIVGIPLFGPVGIVLLAPLAVTVAKEAHLSTLRVGLPLVISLTIN